MCFLRYQLFSLFTGQDKGKRMTLQGEEIHYQVCVLSVLEEALLILNVHPELVGHIQTQACFYSHSIAQCNRSNLMLYTVQLVKEAVVQWSFLGNAAYPAHYFCWSYSSMSFYGF